VLIVGASGGVVLNRALPVVVAGHGGLVECGAWWRGSTEGKMERQAKYIVKKRPWDSPASLIGLRCRKEGGREERLQWRWWIPIWGNWPSSLLGRRKEE
jgi:hypothetical protein